MFAVNSSSRFPFRVRTDRHTNSQTQLIAISTHRFIRLPLATRNHSSHIDTQTQCT